jgi:hypothetical protein
LRPQGWPVRDRDHGESLLELQRQIIRQPAKVNRRMIADPDGAGAETGQRRLELWLQQGALDNDDRATKSRNLVGEFLRGRALAHIDLRKPLAQHGARRYAIETASRCDQDETGHAGVPLRRKR